MFKVENLSYQKSVHDFIYVQGEKPFMPRIRSTFLSVQGRKPFIQRINAYFMIKGRNCSCQESVHDFLSSRRETVYVKNPIQAF
jgi:hypothetical protein